MIDGLSISCEIALRWMSLDLVADESTLVQVMARQQSITCSNVDPDLCRHVASLGHNEWTHCGLVTPYGDRDLQGCQVLLNFSILLLISHFCYRNFGQNTEICLNFSVFLHKNTEICVRFCKNTEISAICYWSEFPEVGSPGSRSTLVQVMACCLTAPSHYLN